MFRFAPVYFLPLNKASETFIADGGAKRLELGGRTFGAEFDAAVGQVANDAGNIKAGGDGLDGVTKSHTLHAARIKNIQAAASGCRRMVGRFRRHRRMKPNSAARRNVFWRLR
jgi:hypothetical protein